MFGRGSLWFTWHWGLCGGCVCLSFKFLCCWLCGAECSFGVTTCFFLQALRFVCQLDCDVSLCRMLLLIVGLLCDCVLCACNFSCVSCVCVLFGQVVVCPLSVELVGF